jgi:hypothetical protein
VASIIFSIWSLGGLVCCFKSRSAAAMNSLLEFSISSPIMPLFAVMVRRRGQHFCSFFPPLEPFLVPLMVILRGVVQPPLTAAPTSGKVKVAPTASSPDTCQVVMSSNSLVVFGYSRPSLLTKERHVMPSQKAEMMSLSATLGSSCHFCEKHQM